MAKYQYSKSLNASKTKQIKGVPINGLNARQVDAMVSHSEHHTKKHIEFMVNAMLKGSSFTESHKLAMQEVGK